MNTSLKTLLSTLFLSASLLLSGCSDESNATFDAAFRQSWNESFIESCTKEAGESGRELCTCVADLAVEKLTKTQLADNNVIAQQIMPECM